jgi:hypothetical protein
MLATWFSTRAVQPMTLPSVVGLRKEGGREREGRRGKWVREKDRNPALKTEAAIFL